MKNDREKWVNIADSIACHMAAQRGTDSKGYTVFSQLAENLGKGMPPAQAIDEAERFLAQLPEPKPKS